MGARKKLNVGYVTGSIVFAAAFGVMAESWLLFLIVMIFMVGCHLYEGNIRPKDGTHHRHHDTDARSPTYIRVHRHACHRRDAGREAFRSLPTGYEFRSIEGD